MNMDLPIDSGYRAQVEEFRRKHRTGLLTLVFTDIVDSTGLKQGFGEREAATLFQDYRALIRSQRAQFSHTEEIERAGAVGENSPRTAAAPAGLGQTAGRVGRP